MKTGSKVATAEKVSVAKGENFVANATDTVAMSSPVKSCNLRCFGTVFRRPYRYFSIALKGILSLSDRYKTFASDWLWVEVCQNVILTKIDITMATINKKIGNW